MSRPLVGAALRFAEYEPIKLTHFHEKTVYQPGGDRRIIWVKTGKGGCTG